MFPPRMVFCLTCIRTSPRFQRMDHGLHAVEQGQYGIFSVSGAHCFMCG
jgi:hypothetical protein